MRQIDIEGRERQSQGRHNPSGYRGEVLLSSGLPGELAARYVACAGNGLTTTTLELATGPSTCPSNGVTLQITTSPAAAVPFADALLANLNAA
jgi:hypothetical protein